MSKKANPYVIKMNAEQLQMYLHFRKRGGKSAMKKGKGSYNRQEQKKMVKEQVRENKMNLEYIDRSDAIKEICSMCSREDECNPDTAAIAAVELGYMDIYDLLENAASRKI